VFVYYDYVCVLIYTYKIFFTHIFIYYTTRVGLLFIYNLRLLFRPCLFLKLLRRDIFIFFALPPPSDAAFSAGSCSLSVSVSLPLTAPAAATAITTAATTGNTSAAVATITTATDVAAAAAGTAGGIIAIINK
jgi:hypothetical protein